MKDGWQLVKLNEVCNIINGRNQKLVESPDGEYPIYGSGGIMGYATDYLCEAGATIIGRKGSINNPIYVETRFWNVDTAFGLLPKPCMNSRLFHYFCLSFDFTKMNKGTTIPSLVKNDLLQIDVPYNPSISEQQRIVGILDAEFEKIDALKTNAEKNLQNAKDLFHAALNLYFTDRKYKSSILGKECDFVRGPFGGSLKKNCFVDAGYPVYEQQHAIYNRFVFRYYVNEKKYLEMKRFTVNGGDLIMSCSGTIGKVAIVPMDAPKGIINQALLKLTPKTNLIPEYLLWYMNSKSFTKQIQEHSQGAAIKNVASVAILKQISLPLPSVNEQREIIQHLNELSNKCKVLQNNYTQTIALCDDLKQALLRKAFSGEL